MTKLSILAGLSALALAGGAAFAQGGMRADLNRDGALSRAEFVQRAAQRFERLDADRDGTVTGDERRQVRAARAEQRQERRGQRAARMEDRLPKLFARVDANRDGRVTRPELDRALATTGGRNDARRDGRLNALFAGADRNADGAVTLAEARVALANWQGTRGRAGARLDHVRDAGRPALTRAEAEARALRRFARLDADRNGRLSPAELQARRGRHAERRSDRG